MVEKKKTVTQFYERYIDLGHKPAGFNSWVDGVINSELMKLEKEVSQ